MLQAIVEHPTERYPLSLRTRIIVKLFRKGTKEPEKYLSGLNELLIDRGGSVTMSMLEAYVNDVHLTTVQADGIIIATPTGSTAYNLSAGGSMLFPTVREQPRVCTCVVTLLTITCVRMIASQVPALCFTPICPHSLSFRPVLIPDSAKITIKLPQDARCDATLSVDGRGTTTMHKGDRVRANLVTPVVAWAEFRAPPFTHCEVVPG